MKKAGRLIEAPILGAARLRIRFTRLADALQRSTGAFLNEALLPDEKNKLGPKLYNIAWGPGWRLYPWEEVWFRDRLPPPPAHILLGGAGAGREATVLADQGYRISAFEPAPRLAKKCGERLGTRGRAVAASYEDLARAVLDHQDTPATPLLTGAPFDAVILGWGSITHVLLTEDQICLLRASARLSPEGPILTSFYVRVKGAEGKLGRAGRVGSTLGSLVGRARGISPGRARGISPERAPLRFNWVSGFGTSFAREDIELLGRAAGRVVIWEGEEGGSFPHVTLVV